MKKLIFILAAFFIAFSVSAKDMPKKLWFGNMSDNFVNVFCKAVEIENCEILSQYALDMCLNHIWDRVPEKIQLPSEGEKYGTIVGTCTEVLVRTVIKY